MLDLVAGGRLEDRDALTRGLVNDYWGCTSTLFLREEQQQSAAAGGVAAEGHYSTRGAAAEAPRWRTRGSRAAAWAASARGATAESMRRARGAAMEGGVGA